MKQVILIIMCFTTFNVSAHNRQDAVINNHGEQIKALWKSSASHQNLMKDLVEIIKTQKKEIKSLKARVKQLEAK